MVGTGLVAIAPDAGTSAGFRANVVVTSAGRETPGRPSIADIDAYLGDLVTHLLTVLDTAELASVWTAGPSSDRFATQRLVVTHCVGGIDVEMAQQHVWFDDVVVTVTATVPAGADQALVDVLDRCLESVVHADR